MVGLETMPKGEAECSVNQGAENSSFLLTVAFYQIPGKIFLRAELKDNKL